MYITEWDAVEEQLGQAAVQIGQVAAHLEDCQSWAKVKSMARVMLENFQRVEPAYLNSLFDAVVSKIAIVCHPLKLVDVSESFK